MKPMKDIYIATTAYVYNINWPVLLTIVHIQIHQTCFTPVLSNKLRYIISFGWGHLDQSEAYDIRNMHDNAAPGMHMLELFLENVIRFFFGLFTSPSVWQLRCARQSSLILCFIETGWKHFEYQVPIDLPCYTRTRNLCHQRRNYPK